MTAPILPAEEELQLDNQLCFKLYAASRAVIRAYKPMLDQLGLTYPQYLAMLVLWEWQQQPPALPTVKALGERLLLDSGTLTPLLKRLELQGLLLRKRSASDEREVHLALSDAGRALREQVLPLKSQLLCERGIDLDAVGALRDQVGLLLDQFMARTGRENVRGRQGKAKTGEKAGFTAVNEHFEPVFNAVLPTHDCMDAGGRATQEAKAEVVFNGL
jgi:DNA-binding MarR family transcriptional regulator